MADREVDKEANEGRDFTHPDEVTTPGASSSSSLPQVSGAASRRNVVREAWAEEKQVMFLRAYVDCEHKCCIRCMEIVETSNVPCGHPLWCNECTKWVKLVLETNPTQPHLCMRCDKAVEEFELYIRRLDYEELIRKRSNTQPTDAIDANLLKEQRPRSAFHLDEGRDFTHPDEVTTPGESSSSSFPQASEAAGRNNVIREAWAEERDVKLPLDEATQKYLVDREEVGICLRCNQTSQIHYIPCFHHPWCRPCKEWADKVVKGKLPNAHLCIICDAKMKNYVVSEVKSNPGGFWRKIVEEKEKEGQNFNTIDEHLMQLKKSCLCHRCLARSTHQNVPCHCRAWCADCSSWAKKLLEKEEAQCICIHCQNPVTAITVLPSEDSSSSSFPQASEAAGGRNVITEAWAEENGNTFPLDEATQKLLAGREEVGICLRCNKTSQICYIPCLHHPWCSPCKQWADRVVKGNLPNPHMCIICDEKTQGCFECNLGPFRTKIAEEKEKEGQNSNTISEHLMQLKTNGLCHRCLARSTHQNVPCHCHAWCDDCTSWAKKLLKKEETRCSRCNNPVTAITLAPPSYDLTPQDKKKKRRQMR